MITNSGNYLLVFIKKDILIERLLTQQRIIVSVHVVKAFILIEIDMNFVKQIKIVPI